MSTPLAPCPLATFTEACEWTVKIQLASNGIPVVSVLLGTKRILDRFVDVNAEYSWKDRSYPAASSVARSADEAKAIERISDKLASRYGPALELAQPTARG